jgi:hypothetical protein
MAALSRPRRSAAGIAFVVAGALVLLGVVLGLAGQALGNWVTVLADIVIAVGFVYLAVGAVSTVARIALLVGAGGWLLLALGAFLAYPPPIWLLAMLAAAAGGLIGAVALYRAKEIPDRAGVAFVVTMISAAVVLLTSAAGIGIDVFGTILSVVFGAGLVVTGFLVRRPHRGR